jgi:hypothetical protein
MESLSSFIKEVYVAKPDSRLTVKEVYEDFREWIIVKYDMKTWNKISQRQVYTALKQLFEYPYVRFKEGFCLKGIARRDEKIPNKELTAVQTIPYLTLNILDIPRHQVIIQPLDNPLTLLPNEQIGLSHEHALLHQKQIALPNENTLLPNENTLLPNENTLLPNEQNFLPNEVKVQHICPRIQGVILPTLGKRS